MERIFLLIVIQNPSLWWTYWRRVLDIWSQPGASLYNWKHSLRALYRLWVFCCHLSKFEWQSICPRLIQSPCSPSRMLAAPFQLPPIVAPWLQQTSKTIQNPQASKLLCIDNTPIQWSIGSWQVVIGSVLQSNTTLPAGSKMLDAPNALGVHWLSDPGCPALPPTLTNIIVQPAYKQIHILHLYFTCTHQCVPQGVQRTATYSNYTLTNTNQCDRTPLHHWSHCLQPDDGFVTLVQALRQSYHDVLNCTKVTLTGTANIDQYNLANISRKRHLFVCKIHVASKEAVCIDPLVPWNMQNSQKWMTVTICQSLNATSARFHSDSTSHLCISCLVLLFRRTSFFGQISGSCTCHTWDYALQPAIHHFRLRDVLSFFGAKTFDPTNSSRFFSSPRTSQNMPQLGDNVPKNHPHLSRKTMNSNVFACKVCAKSKLSKWLLAFLSSNREFLAVSLDHGSTELNIQR